MRFMTLIAGVALLGTVTFAQRDKTINRATEKLFKNYPPLAAATK